MSKTFGEKGIELVKEASRSNFNLTPFNEDVVRQVKILKLFFSLNAIFAIQYLFINQLVVFKMYCFCDRPYLHVNDLSVRPLKRLVPCGKQTGRRWKPPKQFLQVFLSGHLILKRWK